MTHNNALYVGSTVKGIYTTFNTNPAVWTELLAYFISGDVTWQFCKVLGFRITYIPEFFGGDPLYQNAYGSSQPVRARYMLCEDHEGSLGNTPNSWADISTTAQVQTMWKYRLGRRHKIKDCTRPISFTVRPHVWKHSYWGGPSGDTDIRHHIPAPWFRTGQTPDELATIVRGIGGIVDGNFNAARRYIMRVTIMCAFAGFPAQGDVKSGFGEDGNGTWPWPGTDPEEAEAETLEERDAITALEAEKEFEDIDCDDEDAADLPSFSEACGLIEETEKPDLTGKASSSSDPPTTLGPDPLPVS